MIVYGLLDSTRQLRYVGQTVRSASDRYGQHLRSAASKTTPPVNAWLRGILNKGERPEMIELESYDSMAAMNDGEEFFIAYAKAIGANLLNIRHGGLNYAGMRHSPEQREKWSRERRGENAGNFGKRWSPEARARASERMRNSIRDNGHPGAGLKRTPEQRARISLAHVGIKYSISEQGMAARKAAMKKLWADPAFRQRRRGMKDITGKGNGTRRASNSQAS